MVKSSASVKLRSGAVFPLNGFGTWKADPGKCAEALRAALDLGYRHIDLAAIYLNERELGSVFKEYCGGPNPKIPRDQLFVTSKLFNTCHARPHVTDAIKQTLSDLQLDYLDLYLIHFPFAWEFTGLPLTKENWKLEDRSAPYNIKWAPAGVTLEETWHGMEDVLEAKLARNIGVSNYNAALLLDMCRYAKVMPAVHQFEGHPLNQRSELVDLCHQLGIQTTFYSVLGSGKDGPLGNEVVSEIAKKLDVPCSAVCIAWGLKLGCAVLAKSTNTERIRANLEAQYLLLDDKDMERLRSIDKELRTCNMVEYWGFPSHC